jgi:radical SAM superfamily enzyme YgiQ (UPF0313 family)
MLTVYASDLTHEYMTISNGTFPLGVGYVASTLKEYLPELDIEVFKYPSDLSGALERSVPDIYLCSMYMWNTNLSLEFARRIKLANPECLIVAGGPNFSKNPANRIKFLKDNAFVDFIIHQEGEIACLYLVKKYLEVGRDICRLKQKDLLSTKRREITNRRY